MGMALLALSLICLLAGMYVAGFQFSPTINGENHHSTVNWVSFNEGTCCDPFDAFAGLSTDFNPDAPNTDIFLACLGADALLHEGLIGSVCLTIDTVGDYTMGGTNFVVGDKNALELPNPVDIAGKLILVQDCSEPPNNDTDNDTLPIGFLWDQEPITVCVNEPFCVDLYIDIPASVEPARGKTNIMGEITKKIFFSGNISSSSQNVPFWLFPSPSVYGGV